MTGWVVKEIDTMITDVESWIGVSEKLVISFLKPIISAVVATGKTEILGDIVAAAPAVAAAFATGGESAAVTAAVGVVDTVVKAQAIQLGTSTVTALGAALAATAAAAQTATAS